MKRIEEARRKKREGEQDIAGNVGVEGADVPVNFSDYESDSEDGDRMEEDSAPMVSFVHSCGLLYRHAICIANPLPPPP